MHLSSMVISRDRHEISVLECILGGLHIDVQVESEPARAQAKLAKSRVDALIVDSQLDGSMGFLREIVRLKNQNSVPLVIVGGPEARTVHQNQAAPFLFEKPISVEQAVRILGSARNTILNRRLHYHREPVDTPVLVCAGDQRIQAQMLNISQGGAKIHWQSQMELSEEIDLGFVLPRNPKRMAFRARVTWTNQNGDAGVKFVNVTQAARRDLQLWLERQYFIR
jgi:DNA-binding response OmpR family regulator